jgi:hypothetical protein
VSYQFYKTLHLVSVMLMFSSLGGLLLHAMNGGTKANNPSYKLAAAGHGASLLVMLVAGFGMLAKGGFSFATNPWIHIKLLLWFVMGALVMVPARAPGLAKPVWVAAPILGGIAAWAAIFKPFTAAG